MTDSARPWPQLVAHRGFPCRYPENTPVGMRAAIAAGAKHVEFDVQMTADRRLLVLHDDNLQRTAAVPQSVFELPLAQLQQISAHEPARFGEQFYPEYLASLEQMLAMLSAHPHVTAWVEAKQESIERFGLQTYMDAILQALQSHQQDCVLISFSEQAIAYAQQHSDLPTGWVLEKYDSRRQKQAASLQPGFLICNQRKVMHSETLWPGDWRWMLYGVESPALVAASAERGAALVETDCIGELMAALQAQGVSI